MRACTPAWKLSCRSAEAELDGWLIDYAAKGTKIQLVGMDKVDGRDTYRVKLTTQNRNSLHVWIDAKTLLEPTIEGQPRRLDGVYHAWKSPSATTGR